MKHQDIIALTGPAVLLNVRMRGKAPTAEKWQKITLEDMTPFYLSELRANIGVSLGAASNGLHTIDCDTEEFFAALLALNPSFQDTLQSHGSRGGNFWLRITGEAPKTGKLRLSVDAGAVGEWRSTGSQTVIHGTHPSGLKYRHNGKEAITVEFSSIVWPDSWDLPWMRGESDPKEKAPEGKASRGAGAVTRPVSPETVEAMLMSIPTRPDRDSWLKISAAVRNSLGDTGEAIKLLKAWSPEETVGEYAQLLKDPFSEISFGTLQHHAAQNGFTGAVRRFFYNGSAFAVEAKGKYIPLNEGAVKQHLSKLGIPGAIHNDILCDIRINQLVDYVGPVAGLRAGLHSNNGSKLLVTSSPNIIQPKKGDASFINKAFSDLLPDETQRNIFLDWLAHCRRGVLAGRRIQSPALALTGKKGDGKSLGIEIVKQCLGGRSANAYRFLSGDTPFNKDLLGAELLVMDDPAASKDHRARVRLAQNIKGNQFAGAIHVEGKNRDGFDVEPVQAVIIAVNSDPEHLRVLPELDESMEDKITLLRSSMIDLPPELAGREEEIKREIAASLPGFLAELDCRDLSSSYNSRGRLKCFWNPEILEAIGMLSPEQQILELVHQLHVVKIAVGGWSGTAATLEGLLTDKDSHVAHAAKRLLSWGGACGTFLGRLADRPGSGVSRGGLDPRTKIQTYVIEGGPPIQADEDGDEPY
jgi:hypothetical protein